MIKESNERGVSISKHLRFSLNMMLMFGLLFLNFLSTWVWKPQMILHLSHFSTLSPRWFYHLFPGLKPQFCYGFLCKIFYNQVVPPLHKFLFYQIGIYWSKCIPLSCSILSMCIYLLHLFVFITWSSHYHFYYHLCFLIIIILATHSVFVTVGSVVYSAFRTILLKACSWAAYYLQVTPHPQPPVLWICHGVHISYKLTIHFLFFRCLFLLCSSFV